jgi:ribosomal-protein-alanine N-acetyltransferase
LPAWLAQPGVHLYIAEGGGEPVGFALVGFERDDEYEGPPPSEGGDWLAADLLAVAVPPTLEGKGLGRLLLGHVLRRVAEVAQWRAVHEVRLTVADKNERARRLFARAGFVDAGVEGRYPNGQRALRMRRPVLLA